ncbi:MAG: DUF2817 domain-containing protein [Bdellovibrio sp.]|jgi:hypothetical protein
MTSLVRTPPPPFFLQTEADVTALFHSIDLNPDKLERKFPEWLLLRKLAVDLVRSGRAQVLGTSSNGRAELPLLGFQFGNPDPKAPVLGLFGGVHGIERIGSQVVLSLMSSFSELIVWDRLLQEALSKMRIVFFPIVNPWGLYHQTRSNPRGVDLMRNAPIEALENPTWLVSGQRFSPRLPWYRGQPGHLEPEAQALVDFVRAQSFASSRVIHLDFHSGFGTSDQIWFPFAKSTKPFPHLPEFHALKEAFEKTHPHHFYKIEPQAKNYTTHGDLWDFLYEDYYRQKGTGEGGIFLPLAVEMGSWMWVKKNPLQLFSTLGPYNPIVPHRKRRILRRHNTLFDFMIRALVSSEVWVPRLEEQRQKHLSQALDLWYSPVTR